MGKAENCEDARQEDSEQVKILVTFKLKDVWVLETAHTLDRCLVTVT